MVPALFGTSVSHTHQQVIDSAWLAQIEPAAASAAQAAPRASANAIAELPASPGTEAVQPAGGAAAEAPTVAEPWAAMELREGDTFFDLAAWFGISADAIALANGLSLDDYVLVGDILVIPIPASQFILPPAPVIYVPEPDPEPAVVAATAHTNTPTPSRSVFAGTSNDVFAAICSLPWPCEQMVRIATCESGLNPRAHNSAGYYGLFQLNFAPPRWDDPWVNAQVAYERKYLPAAAAGDGLSPWPGCRWY